MTPRTPPIAPLPGERPPNVYTIRPGLPFVDALAAGIEETIGDEPSILAAVTILLPTRRACRSLTDAFLRRSAGRPLLLPRMLPLGDIDEDELALGGADETALFANTEIPPAISPLRRQLLLMRVIHALYRTDPVPADQAARLAAELARLLDQVHTERLDFRRLPDLVPDRFAEHWEITLKFLSILTDAWPRVLAEEGCVDPAERRNLVLEAQARAWLKTPPKDRVIAAGSTGSMPATAELLAVVARMPRGALILPGLDTAADDDTWTALKPTHPQYGMARLLARLGLDRRDVRPWPAGGVGGTPPERAALIARALRPAATAGSDREPPPPPERALASVRRIDAPGPEEEARTIALIMRGTLEHPEKTAALVTPDRPLARRVARELERWNVEVDDSAGRPLAETPPGAFLRLTARMVAEDAAPVPLLSVVKHPLAACGLFPAQFRARVRHLERTVLRGPRPPPGFAGLTAAVQAKGGEPELMDILARLTEAVDAFAALFAAGTATIRDLLRAHMDMAERLAASHAETGAERLWAGEAGEAAAGFVAELNEAADGCDPLATDAYPALLDVLLAGRVVRPRYGRHPRIAILGPLEARLQQTDVMILGSLNEDTWPPKTHASPWMSRPMMREFGLPLPERRIGLSAHDFAQAFSAPEVWLTRSSRMAGSPTVPCRWLLRLENVIQMAGGSETARGAGPWLRWQANLDAPERVRAIDPPEPRPPVTARPRRLSVTQVETWMRDPYAIYARHILKLRALDPIDADPTAADYGARIHRALDEFVAKHPGPLPANAANAIDALLEAGREAFGGLLEQPAIAAFWWPRFERIARWFVDVERDRRAGIQASFTEVEGTMTIDVPEDPFAVTAIADRIDLLADGSLAIIDYKTGAPPSEKEVKAGFAPQLPLEAAIAEAGGFTGIAARAVSDLTYWRLSGGEPAGQQITLKTEPRELAGDAIDGLRALVTEFDMEATPYRSRPSPAAAPKFSDYEHLARVKEWSAGGDEDD